jgi:hypothetical protein
VFFHSKLLWFFNMTEHHGIPEIPPTDYLIAFHDGQGNYTPRPLMHDTDEHGKTFPRAQPNAESLAAAHDKIEAWRMGVQAEVVAQFDGVPCLDPESYNEERIDHFFRALGLPTAKVITALSTNDLPRDGRAAELTQWFRKVRSLSGKYFNTPRLIIVVGTSANGTVGDNEQIIAHEKAHSTGRNTAILTPDEDNDVSVQIVRSGFSLFRPVDLAHIDLAVGAGQVPEEAQANLYAAVYAQLFLGRPDITVLDNFSTIDRVEAPGKYSYKGVDGSGPISYSSSALAALALEAVAERDPQILDSLFSARLSMQGLRSFAQRVNALVPGMYSFMQRGKDTERDHAKVLTRVVNTLYGGDWSALSALGATVQEHVVQRLAEYEQRTGYSFGLPPSVMRGAVLLDESSVGGAATSPGAGTSHRSAGVTGDPVIDQIYRVIDTM